jgi:molecular chaperone DnaK (HSP70)
MKLGIDFGTTRIVVAAVDRGNYPIISFDGPDDTTAEWVPPLVAVNGKERRYGWDAWPLQQEPGWTTVRSLKRYLEDSGPETLLEIAGEQIPLQTMLVEMMASLKAHLLERSSLPADKDEALEVMLGVPANANSNQRFLTVEAFRHAGFSVLGLLNEPSAASLEYGHGNRSSDGYILVYGTGGGSELPLVSRVLKEQFGRKVRRSAYTRSATAIGLAIQADASAGYVLREMFTRNFGVWREGQGGRNVVFDQLFPRGSRLPGHGEPPLVNSRRYFPVHNVGHFRYLECSQLRPDGQPAGDITVWDEIRFPFDPALKKSTDLTNVPVTHSSTAEKQEVEEKFSCDSTGAVTVTIGNITSHYSRDYRLGRWSSKAATVIPGKRKRAAK